MCFPFILLFSILGCIFFLLTLPCYICGRCCCGAGCCCVVCVDDVVVKKMIKFPCISCLWIAQDTAHGVDKAAHGLEVVVK